MNTLNQLLKKLNLNHNEYELIQKHLNRYPNGLELDIYSVCWSEHCCYKSSKLFLRNLPTQSEHVIHGPGENAGVVSIGDGLAVVMKVESHNHPSAIDPIQGAATGVGGVIRDIVTMGARPIATLNSLRCSDKQKHYFLAKLVQGITSYGNNFGIPCVGGEIYFEDTYHGNPLVNAMCVGILRQDELVLSKAKGVGNVVLYAGSKTSTDGVQGASFASETLDNSGDWSQQETPIVPYSDPLIGRGLMESCMQIKNKDFLVSMQDMGAGGISGSASEMAAKGKIGVLIHLDKVPIADADMEPYQILLSETQERMLAIIKKGYDEDAIAIFKNRGIHACIIGELIEEPQFRIEKSNKIIADIPVASLIDQAPVYELTWKEKPVRANTITNEEQCHQLDQLNDWNSNVLRLIERPNICSRQDIYENFDTTVGNQTIFGPGESDAAILKIRNTEKAIALSIDGNGRFVEINPRIGSQMIIAEACRNLVCSGAKPIAITDGLNFGNPNDKTVFWQLKSSIDGIKDACQALSIPVISGNVSLYNETSHSSIYPTAVIGSLGVLKSVEDATSISFKNEGDLVLMLGSFTQNLNGSEYLKMQTKRLGNEIYIDLQLEQKIQNICLQLIQNQLVQSAHDISDGGLIANLIESCIAGNLGIDIKQVPKHISKSAYLFEESPSRIVISINKENLNSVESILNQNKISWNMLGEVRNDRSVQVESMIDLTLDTIKIHWDSLIC